ncbi:MAG TPA: sigma-70 family RNA polymerase sigma factor [Candidatus Acidoferrum sp.]|nr:sigma-70 family RNA polymerase sigma factor [Candidatus Acidoferrum sp.]
MTESQTLLADYAGNGSEAAFRELVARYIDFVYSAAARLVDGAPHLAEDVTQIVFADLARQAGALSREVMLGGWLHRHTCFVAANLMRGERRRQSRERQAAAMNAMTDHSAAHLAQMAPILDEAINGLGAADRTAILLRFFEQRDWRAIGQTLGGNEESARKRVARALEKLHAILKRRGVTFSAAALATALATGTVTAAPAGLAATVAGSALAAAAGGGSALTLLKIMALTKLKIGIVGGLVAASLVTTLVIQQQAQAKLRQDEASLREQSHRLAQLQAGHESLSPPAARNLNTPNELARLRAEAAALRPQTNDLAALREEDRQRQKAAAADAKPKSPLRQTAEAMTKLNYSKELNLAFLLYADKNQHQFPTNFDQAAPFLGPDGTNRISLASDQFEIVYHGSMDAITNPGNAILIREKQPRQSNGNWSRVYGFADGHSEIHGSPDGNFEEWESQHLATPTGQ